MKKIVFVAHEFGLFKGHGGVASYLNILVSKILERRQDYIVYVITTYYDKESELLNNERLHLFQINAHSYNEQGKQVLEYLRKIEPDYVECTDYTALGLESLFYRAKSEKNELSNTVFITLHHTASRECYEWNDKVPVFYAPYHIKDAFIRERTQMKLSDLNIAPSEFMNKYVSKNYCLNDVITISHPLLIEEKSKIDLAEYVNDYYDINRYKEKFIVNCISRIEGRKNQKLLVLQFIKFLESTKTDAYLILVGNSSINTVTLTDFKQEIYDIIPNRFRKNILFYDFMGTKEKENILAISDLSILASPFECLSLAMTESLYCDVPVITSRYCGFVDYMGETKGNMSFDPFVEDDLFKKILNFYNLSAKERNEITISQKNNLIKVADFSLTIDNRLSIYEKSKNTNVSLNNNTLIIDERNFQNIINDEILEKKYDSLLINWYFDKSNAENLVKVFNKIDSHFSSGDIVCFGGEMNYQHFIDLIIGYIPFYIKGIKFDDSMIGQPIWKFILNNTKEKQLVYCLQSDKNEFKDMIHNKLEINFEKREFFRKCLLESLFYKENKISLEDRYAE